MIGPGIRLSLKGEGDVWLTVLGEKPVYVQSHQLDVQAKRFIPDQSHTFVQFTNVRVIYS